ncbi:MAG: cellulose 1,4-beta-cellobiosidase, partial [Ruminococcus sp.]|nr:cellulose 1,4-beta-cellobiosidase [Ruminococcus sp.]
VLIMQSISNPGEYPVTEQGQLNGDVIDNGSKLTNMDALAIQMSQAKLISTSDFPMTTDQLNAVSSK